MLAVRSVARFVRVREERLPASLATRLRREIVVRASMLADSGRAHPLQSKPESCERVRETLREHPSPVNPESGR